MFEVVYMPLIELWIYCRVQESHPESNFRVPAIVSALEKMELTPKVLNEMYNMLHSIFLRLLFCTKFDIFLVNNHKKGSTNGCEAPLMNWISLV